MGKSSNRGFKNLLKMGNRIIPILWPDALVGVEVVLLVGEVGVRQGPVLIWVRRSSRRIESVRNTGTLPIGVRGALYCAGPHPPRRRTPNDQERWSGPSFFGRAWRVPQVELPGGSQADAWYALRNGL